MDERECWRTKRHCLQCRNEADSRPLFSGKPRTLFGSQLLDNRNTGFIGIDLGFDGLDARGDGGRRTARLAGFVAGRRRGSLETAGALFGGAFGCLRPRKRTT